MVPKLELGNGVFADINEAIEAAAAAQKVYEKRGSLDIRGWLSSRLRFRNRE